MATFDEPGNLPQPDPSDAAFAMAAPGVPAVIDPDDPTGLLPLSALGQNLAVTFREFGRGVAPDEEDLVELGFMSFGGDFRVVDSRWYPTGDVIVFPQTLEVPRDYLTQDIYEVAIRVSIYGSNPSESPRKRLTIDTMPPNFGNKPDAGVFPAELGGTITEAFLSAEGEVSVYLPMFFDVRAGDRAVYFWSDRDPPLDSETPIREQEFSEQDIIDKQLRVTVYAGVIRAWGAGKRYFYYFLRDRAGNTGPKSYLADILVDLTPAPGALPPPRVPLSPRGLVDRQQARDGVRVLIDAYEFADPGHWVAIFWDDTPLAEFAVNPAAFPLAASVPWPTLQAKGDGPLSAKVYYRIRQGTTYGPPSPDISLSVDLSLAGQDHGNAPALINATLALVEVYGEKSATRNSLSTEDYGFAARALLTLYDNPKPSQVLELFWGNYPGPVATYTVKPGDVAGQTIEFIVPWAVIDTDKQNPVLPVRYTTTNGVNQQQSLPTPVRVAIVLIDNLKEPSFPHATKHGVLHCCARPRLWEGVTVRIEADPRIEQGDKLILFWQGCEGPNGTRPIPSAYDAIEKRLDTLVPGQDIDIVVEDYENLIKPMVKDASGLAWYRLEKSTGAVGFSKADFVIINRTMPSGEVCSPDNDLCDEN